jgi:hypothetical protein
VPDPGPIIAASSQGLPVGAQADTFTLNSVACPGLCTLTSCEANTAWDVREAYGFNFATIVPKGEKLTEPTFTVELWEGTVQYPAWLSFAQQYLSRVPTASSPATPGSDTSSQPSVASRAFAFSHVIASAPPFSVTAVLVQSVSYKGRGDGGSFLFEVKLLEYKQPAAAAPVVTGQQAPAVGGGPPAATDALGAEQNDASDTLSNRLNTYNSIPGWS